MGFDDGSRLVGGIIRRGLSLSDEALRVVDTIGDDLAEAGIKLSDEAEDGVGILAKNVDPEEALSFSDELMSLCGTMGSGKSSAKMARLALASNTSECVNQVQEIIGKLDQVAQKGLKKLCKSLGSEAAELAWRHADNPERLKGMFRILGESSYDFRRFEHVDGLERLVFNSGEISVDILKYLPLNMLDERIYPGIAEFLINSNYLDENYYLMKSLAEQGDQSSLLGHIKQLQGEYRELRFHQFATNDGQGFLFRHIGPINEGGVDAVTQKGNIYYWVDVKDKSQGAGLIINGPSSGSTVVGVGDLENYISSQNGAYFFDRDYFGNEVIRLRLAGEIDLAQAEALLEAVDEGRVEVMIFAGGSLNSFSNVLLNLDNLINPASDIPVRFNTIFDWSP